MTNNATSFQGAVIENAASVFLGQGHFEEQVAFQKNEADQPIQIMMLETHDAGGVDREAHHQVDRRRITFFCARDPVVVNSDGSTTTWSAIYGAPFYPQLGNVLQRSDGTRWAWLRIQAEDFASFTLEFEFNKVLKAGGRPMGM